MKEIIKNILVESLSELLSSGLLEWGIAMLLLMVAIIAIFRIKNYIVKGGFAAALMIAALVLLL